MGLFFPISEGFLKICTQNVCGKAILMFIMCLVPILVGVVYGGIIYSTTPYKGLHVAPINEMKEVLINKRFNTKNALNMANSKDPDETPRLAASHLGLRYFKCSFFFLFSINVLTTHHNCVR